MRMFIASALVEIMLYESHSLKEKRHIMRSLISKLSNQFNISIAEIGYLDKWQRGELGVACVANDPVYAQKIVDGAIGYMEEDGRFEIINIKKEVY